MFQNSLWVGERAERTAWRGVWPHRKPERFEQSQAHAEGIAASKRSGCSRPLTSQVPSAERGCGAGAAGLRERWRAQAPPGLR